MTKYLAIALHCARALRFRDRAIRDGRYPRPGNRLSGGAVPEANVKIENQKTGVHKSTVTNGQGAFLQPYLIPENTG